MAFAYVEADIAKNAAKNGAALQVMLLGDRRNARILTQSAYDPSNLRPRA
jgi:glycine cleavage system aminomethyltransferase T